MKQTAYASAAENISNNLFLSIVRDHNADIPMTFEAIK